ncbi:MAG: hypothetical protein OEV37_02855 [Candidatus Berkelbacteria bacterium]|nr:hypothetical protein [Candidatus Berkelbacteria bacterium]
MARWIKILLIVVAVIVIGGGAFLFLGTLKRGGSTSSSPKPTPSINPASASDAAGFELKKSSAYYTVYYHTGDDANADKTLEVLGQAVDQYYKTYYGITPQNTPVYLALTVDEYVKVADFPGGKENVQIGDGSAPNGKIYLYKPFDDPQKGEGVIIHEGAHAAVYSFLGGGQLMENIPGFLNEGMAYHVEYAYNAGTDYKPLKEIYFVDLLRKAANTSTPALMSLDELGKNCEGYISDENRNGLCRGQGTFTVWHMAKNYGQDFWAKFLADIKTSNPWQKSLETLSGKSIDQLSQEINEALKSQL